MATNKSKIISLVILISLVFTACNEEKISGINPDKTYIFSYENKHLKLKQNKPFLLFFMSKNCGICTHQIPILNQLKGIIKIAVINDAKNLEEAKLIKQNKKLALSLVYKISSVDFLASAVGGVQAVPLIVIYDAKGRQHSRLLGLSSLKKLRQELSSLSYLER